MDFGDDALLTRAALKSIFSIIQFKFRKLNFEEIMGR